METEKRRVEDYDRKMKLALDYWKASPDDPEMFARMKSILKATAGEKLDLAIGISDRIFDNPEASRGITRNEIKKYAYKRGDSWFFYLKPRRAPDSNFEICVTDLLNRTGDRGIIDKYNFVIRVGFRTERQSLLVLRPYEITGISVR